MPLLLHVCCAECLLGAMETLGGDRFVGFFYNPNVHPLIEFRRRLKAVRVLAEQQKLQVVCDASYGLREFLDAVDYRTDDAADRCRQCYLLRLRRAAAEAVRRGCDAFSTTLLVSRHQTHEAVRQVGEQVAAEAALPFDYHDWRGLAECGHQEARRRNLYRQQYCGCIFSEYERYKDTGLHLYRGAERSG